ncbi:MAG: glycoside hydrolase family 9 protein [Muribaculaceae bacterium]|nr:glycoside hydrolase family 9 protein [Muribaculaceae bacterium]
MTSRLYTTLAAIFIATAATAAGHLRANQIGYLTDDVKAIVYLGNRPIGDYTVTVVNEAGRKSAPDSIAVKHWDSAFTNAARIYVNSIKTPGVYRLELTAPGEETVRTTFNVGDDVYSRHYINELPLNYMRQQRCGFNPVLGDSCHTTDGFRVLSGDLDGSIVDVTGGWHDASDYLQYLTTSANAVYQMLFAYSNTPAAVWADDYDAAGLLGSNGVPDILDEARWGLEWMMKMNPAPGVYFNQIADDRDHRFAGLPADDNVDYGMGAGGRRPVYPCSGKPYGLQGNLNRSTGEASSVAKFASSFGLGAEIFKTIDPAFADSLDRRSAEAYTYATAHPGACQTAPCVSPYFYEEDNWADDLELAAMARYRATGERRFVDEAVGYGRLEPVTPWMGADSARHYQWYPFLNLGQFELAKAPELKVAREFARNLRSGIARVAERGADNAFLNGIPFIWCSNNLTTAFVTQAMLYRDLTGDETYRDAETAARDWLFGVNPWGQTMIVLPDGIDASSPRDCHSALSNTDVHGHPGHRLLAGGLVDGPVYTSIFNSLRGVHLRNADRFEPFQSRGVVYHDDYSDYSTNEPTMDGTASMTYFLGRLAAAGLK